MRKLTMDEVTFELKVEQDDTPLEGNVQASGDDEADARAENDVQEALDMGNIWAWCSVTVIARWNGFEGRDHLGCCSYDSEEDFKQDVYYADMKQAALDDLNSVISDTAERLRPMRSRKTGLVHIKSFQQVKEERDFAYVRLRAIYEALEVAGDDGPDLETYVDGHCDAKAPERIAALQRQLRRLQTGNDIESDRLTDQELKLLARAEKAEQERDEAQALANTLHRRLDVWVERAEQAESERDKLKSRIDTALEAAGNRWEEWGERALSVADILSGDVEPGTPHRQRYLPVL